MEELKFLNQLMEILLHLLSLAEIKFGILMERVSCFFLLKEHNRVSKTVKASLQSVADIYGALTFQI